MSNLQVINLNGVLVVDSRLIAEELGIQHTSFKDTVSKYRERLESLPVNGCKPVPGASGNRLIKETTTKMSDGSGGETVYYLTEEQSNALMTLSANTQKVVDAKFKLVEVFSLAKAALIEQIDNNKLYELIIGMKNDMKLLTERTQKLDEVTQEKLHLEEKLVEIDDAGIKHKGAYAVIKAEVNNDSLYDDYINVDQFLAANGIKITNSSKLNRIRRRTASFYRTSKCENPKSINNRRVYTGSDVEYIKVATKSEIGYIFN